MRRRLPYHSFELNLPGFRPKRLRCVKLMGRLATNGRFDNTADCRHALVLQMCLDPEDFSRMLYQCADKSIAVF